VDIYTEIASLAFYVFMLQRTEKLDQFIFFILVLEASLTSSIQMF